MPPILRDFPVSPADKSGWPWNEESASRLVVPSIASDWPLISIVTPSFNQARFLEETIRSVLLQGYPRLDYIVIDGGSTDGSVEIIQKYAPWLTDWVSEPDNGQAHAINKGFERATGTLVGWLNSDDFLLPGALRALAEAYRTNPEALIAGDVINFMDGARRGWVTHQHSLTAENLVAYWREMGNWHQPGLYWPRNLFKQVGFLDASLQYAFDRDFFARILLQGVPVTYLHQTVAAFRLHSSSKTMSMGTKWHEEQQLVSRRYFKGDERELEAAYAFDQALTSLSIFYIGGWNRKKAAKMLLETVKRQPPRLFTFKFLGTVARLFWPRVLATCLRSRWLANRATVALPN